MYQSLLNLIITTFGLVEGTFAYDSAQFIAVALCVFLAAVPFMVLWKVIKFLVR